MMDDIAFSDWPGPPVDLSGSNPWLPAYGYQPPSTLLDKDDFIGNPDAALFLQGSSPHYVFLETIVEETSDDLRSESDRSGSRSSPVGWLATDSESGSVIHVDLEGLDEIDSGSESEIACPAKRRRQDPNLLTIAGMYSDSDSNHSLSRSSSLLQFETLEKHCQDVYSSSPSILSLYSQDSLEQQRKSNDLSPDSLDRCHSDSESESDYYKMLKIDVPKSKRYRDSLFYNTKRLSDSSDSKSDSDSQDSDETLQVASRSNSCRSVQNLKSCRSFDSLNVKSNKKDKMSAENLSEDSGYSDHLCNYMKNKSSSIPNMQVQGISVPEKSTNKVTNELKKVNARIHNNSNEDINSFRLKYIKVSADGFDAYDGEPCFQNFASHFGSSYQDLTMFEKYEPLTTFKSSLIDRFTRRSGSAKRGSTANPDWCRRVPQTDVLSLGSPVECVATSKFSITASASEPNLFQPVASSEIGCFANDLNYLNEDYRRLSLDKTQVQHCKQNGYFEGSVCVSSVPNDLNLAGDSKHCEENTWTFANNRTSIAAKNWDLADLPPAETNLEFTDHFTDDAIGACTVVTVTVTDTDPEMDSNRNKMAAVVVAAANVYQQEGSNVTAVIKDRESSSISSGSDISMPRFKREGSYIKAISEYLEPPSEDEREKSYTEPLDATDKILDIDSEIQKAISESSIQSITDDTTKIRMFFHSTPINKRNVNSTPNLSSITCEKQMYESFQDNVEMRRSMQNMPRKSSLIDRSTSTSGVSDAEDRTLTSKTLSGSSSTTKGVHFCPVVSEVSWRDSSSDDMSSYSISSNAHETTPEPVSPPPPPIRPPRDLKTLPRKSASQPSLPRSGGTENETEYIFIPLNPHKWASSTPTMSHGNRDAELGHKDSSSTESDNNNADDGRGVNNETTTTVTAARQKNHGGVVYKSPPTGRHVSQTQQGRGVQAEATVPPLLHQQQQQQKPKQQAVSVAVMESAVAHRPVAVTMPAKPTRTAKLGGFLSRFASFRFSTRKSNNDDKVKKKGSSADVGNNKKQKAQQQATGQIQSAVATEKDYIYIPLKGPLPPGTGSHTSNRRELAANGSSGGHNNTHVVTTTTTRVLVDGRDVTDSDFGTSAISPRHVQQQQQQQHLNNNRENKQQQLRDGGGGGSTSEMCISAKPPLPKLPPRVVSACVKKQRNVEQGGAHIPSSPATALRTIDSGVGGGAVATVPRNASSMEPMGLIETDLDTEVTVITAGTGAHVKTRSLMNLGGAEPPPQGGHHHHHHHLRGTLLAGPDNANRPHKSMEFLLDKQNLKAVEPPENELQKGTGERVMSEHQLRVQRSLQKLTVPEWYKQNQVPREGFILKKQRNEPRWTGTGTANNSKTPSLSSLGSGHSPVLLSPTPHSQPFTRWSTSKLNSAASSPCASTRSSFNHRTSNGGISPCSVRSSFSYRQPYLGWRSQERLTRPRTPAERLATSLLPNNNLMDNTESPEIQTSIKEVTSAIVHYVSGLKPDQHDHSSLSPNSSPRLGRDSVSPRMKGYESQDTASQRSASPQSRGSQKLCWLESSFVGTRPLDSPQTPVSLTSESASQQPLAPPATLRLDLQKNINNEMISHVLELNTSRPSPSSTTLEDVLDSLLGLPPSTRAPSPSLQETGSANTSPSKLADRGGDQYRRRSEGSEPSNRPTAVSSEAPRRVSFHASPSPSSDSAATVKCRYSRCAKISAKHSDTGKKYKNCHNCTYIYCSRECRRAHWEKHRMTCLFSRVGTLCRQVLAAAKENQETLKHLSLLARQGFLAQSQGAVKCFFSSPECAEKFIAGNAKALGEPVYIPWADLLPSEMGPNLYSDLIKMCKTYNPDTKFVLYVSVCVVSEVPASGAVKWERQLVSRCAKIRLCKSVLSTITPSTLLDKKTASSKDALNEPTKTVIVKTTTHPPHDNMSILRSRELSFAHIQRQLRHRGVSLKRQFPEVYQKLCAYVEGKSDKFAPVTVYPKDANTGKSFMCIIMPDVTEPDKLKLKLPTDSPRTNITSDVD